MPGENDDVPLRTRGAVRPPPSVSPGDAPDSIEVPRMSPPPPSLGAMVERDGWTLNKRRPERADVGIRAPTPGKGEKAASLWIWGVVALVTAALTAYLMR